MRSYREAMAAYFTFAGRTGRASFWQYILVVLLLSIVAHLADVVLKSGNLIYGVFALVHFFPSWAAQVRRLHDVDRSGWWLLLIAIPLIGAIPLLVWCCSKSQPEPNRFDLPGTGTGTGSTAALAAAGELRQEPAMGTAVPPPAGVATTDQPQAVQAQARRRKITPLHGVLVVAGIGVSLALLAHANGGRLPGSSGPQCSDRVVTDLIEKILRDNTAKSELQPVLTADPTGVEVQDIRTRSVAGKTTTCAAHIKLTYKFNPIFVAANPDAVLSLSKAGEFDATYTVEPTDDGKHIYVNVKQ